MGTEDRRRMRVTVHNDSKRALTLKTSKLDWGEWTPGWDPGKRPVIAPGASFQFRAEGDYTLFPTTGAEGRVRYAVDGTDGELYIHFDNPLVKSQYGNTFHVWAPPGFEAPHTGGQGTIGELVIRFGDSVKHIVPRFRPSESGLHFINGGWPAGISAMTVGRLVNALRAKLGGLAVVLGIPVFPDDFLPVTDAGSGLCGGMVFAVRDYREQGLYPPATATTPADPRDPLTTYIRDRLIDSFDMEGSGSR